jgi:wyosine [tRNA(Phe)-imidazoG37] synthetase (radical SAM superfamily)
LTVSPEEYVPLTSVQNELAAFLSTSPELDHITFSGAGEPTLHSGIGEMVDFIKSNFPRYKLALLTNSTLLGREDVRNRLLAIDVVVASVDAAGKEAFQRVSRPHSTLSIEDIVAGLVSFRDVFQNSLWVEVFLVPGVNNSLDELSGIRKMLERIRPDRVQVNTLDRPGTETWVAPMETEEMERAASFLQSAELISLPVVRETRGTGGGLADRILAAVQRRPLTIEDISRMLGIEKAEALEQLQRMTNAKVLKRDKMPRGTFYLPEREE